MGSISDRVLQAADIYNEGKFRRVLMVETAPSANLEFIRTRGAKIITDAVQCEEALISLGVPEDSITILNGWATSVITSYSIHYTKLYDSGMRRRIFKVFSALFYRPGFFFHSQVPAGYHVYASL